MRLHLDALVLMQRIWGVFGAITAAALAVLAVGAEAGLIESGSVSRADLGAVRLLGACAALLGTGASGAFLVARGLKRRSVSARFTALVQPSQPDRRAVRDRPWHLHVLGAAQQRRAPRIGRPPRGRRQAVLPGIVIVVRSPTPASSTRCAQSRSDLHKDIVALGFVKNVRIDGNASR
jgi:hypothetical protein